MFKNNSDFIPRTYSIRGYKRRESLVFKKIIKYSLYLVIIAFILGVTFLSSQHLI